MSYTLANTVQSLLFTHISTFLIVLYMLNSNGFFWYWLIRTFERDPWIKQTSCNTDINTNKVHQWEHIITSNDHTQICNTNVLQTSNDCCCQCRVMHCAKYNWVCQYTSHYTWSSKLYQKEGIAPACICISNIYISCEPGQSSCWNQHKQCIVEHESMFTKLCWVQFWFCAYTIGCCECII